MRWLFVKERLAWPRSSGHDVHCFHLMQALARLGHEVALATVHELAPEAVAGGRLESTFRLTGAPPADAPPVRLSKWQEKFRFYWGIESGIIREVGALARGWHAEAVVVVGLNVLPYLGAIEGSKRVWYAADEWAWHHASQVSPLRPATWGELRQAAVKGLYERAYAPLLDRVWVVSQADRRAMRLVAGVRGIDVLPNGVDSDHYRPGDEPQVERSCVFWGRLDFGPNVQALEWFCRSVWPAVRRRAPDARLTVYGFQPTPPVLALAGPGSGVEVVPDRPDIRAEIRRHQAVVLPFVSGGGIKNKLLEAAALGMPVVCTPRTVRGLSAGPAVVCARRPGEWVRCLLGLWADAAERRRRGGAARAWVVRDHTWEATARKAVLGLSGAA